MFFKENLIFSVSIFLFIISLVFVVLDLSFYFSHKRIKRKDWLTLFQWVMLLILAAFFTVTDFSAFPDVQSWLDYQSFLTNILGQLIIVAGIHRVFKKAIKIKAN